MIVRAADRTAPACRTPSIQRRDSLADVCRFRRGGVGATVPDLHRHQAQQRPAVDLHRQHRMQQQPARRAALADYPVSSRRRPSPAQHQLAGVLDRNDLTPRHPPARLLAGMLRHRRRRHRPVAQKARELHLPRPRPAKPPDARTRPTHQCGMKMGPPFSSRSSPNRPRPYSTQNIDLSVFHPHRQRISHHILTQQTLQRRGAAGSARRRQSVRRQSQAAWLLATLDRELMRLPRPLSTMEGLCPDVLPRNALCILLNKSKTGVSRRCVIIALSLP